MHKKTSNKSPENPEDILKRIDKNLEQQYRVVDEWKKIEKENKKLDIRIKSCNENYEKAKIKVDNKKQEMLKKAELRNIGLFQFNQMKDVKVEKNKLKEEFAQLDAKAKNDFTILTSLKNQKLKK
ncbi:MAG: hypothetical protein ACOX75_06700 [Lachnospiraceae bacterium]|jgi:multidrug resistance efflux pump